MPLVPLYIPDVPPLASHRVTSPGGYEWWQFVIKDADRSCRLEIYDGNPHDPAYRRAYARYRRRPTRCPPPQPDQYQYTTLVLDAGPGRGDRSTIEGAARLPDGFRPDGLLQTDGRVVLACSVGGGFSFVATFTPRQAWAPSATFDLTSAECDATAQIVLGRSGAVVKIVGTGMIRQRFGVEPTGWK